MIFIDLGLLAMFSALLSLLAIGCGGHDYCRSRQFAPATCPIIWAAI
ncbi:MAG: hypothetical protein ACJAQ6_002066 [Arenicella sp.]|jgi:hypothetical protein